MSAAASRGRSSRLVGREIELARLHALASGSETIVLVAGEAGVGKTSLVDELASSVRVAAGNVVRGDPGDVADLQDRASAPAPTSFQ